MTRVVPVSMIIGAAVFEILPLTPALPSTVQSVKKRKR